jgi:hypothetical protein
MAKPATFDGYSDQYTVDCERVLVTLLRGLGPWKESVYLIGGTHAAISCCRTASGSASARRHSGRGHRDRPATPG